MTKKQKLELTWIGKDERPKLEPRILIEDTGLSYCGTEQKPGGIFDNLLIKGDNLLALKALEQEYAGKVKCIYIDPPYNTGSAIPDYDDGREHSLWLSLMRDRLELLRVLLSSEGSIWVSINDHEAHYLKVLMDEVFGRANFIASNSWQMIYTVKNSARHFSSMHEYVLVYAREIEQFELGLVPRDAKQDDAYSNPDDDPRGAWKATPLHARNYYSLGQYEITTPSQRKVKPPSGTYWRVSEDNFKEMAADNRIWWGRNKDAVPAQKRFLSEVKQGVTPTTLWLHEDAGHNAEAKNEIRRLFGEIDEHFLTPKPERLIKKILELSTRPGELVLDSFGGSGTTAAVAHKMGRRWITVELGDHAETLIVPRMKKVIDGDDPGGVTESAGWQGGGGFRYYTLAPSLLEKDKYDNWVISKKYDANMLAAAVCKLMGFTYEPSRDERDYWRHGHSTETDFIYVTTQSLTYDALKRLSEDVGRKRTLLVCCKAYNAKDDAFENLTLRKIPQVVLKKCEWGRDDYSLKIAKVAPPEEPVAPPAVETEPTAAAPAKRTRKPRKKPDLGTPDMFAKRLEA